MAKFDDLLQAVKVHEVLKSKEENEKKCKFCKRIIVGKSKLGICPDCLNKACNRVVGIGSALVSIGGAILFKNGNFKKK